MHTRTKPQSADARAQVRHDSTASSDRKPWRLLVLLSVPQFMVNGPAVLGEFTEIPHRH